MTVRGVKGPLLDGVLGLHVGHEQQELFAGVQKSMAQVAAHPAVHAFAVFEWAGAA